MAGHWSRLAMAPEMLQLRMTGFLKQLMGVGRWALGVGGRGFMPDGLSRSWAHFVISTSIGARYGLPMDSTDRLCSGRASISGPSGCRWCAQLTPWGEYRRGGGTV